MELLEYSENEGIPNIKNFIEYNKFYAGPMNYFIKRNEKFINIFNQEELLLSENDIVVISENLRQLFVGENVKSKISNNSEIKFTVPKFESVIDDQNRGDYIDNASYFLSDPYHGYNEHGTCGSVAAQILLGYHNYYSDRRIILNKYLFANSSDNPNTCSDPGRMTRNTTGSNEDFYQYIIGKIEPSALTCKETKNADGEIEHSHDGSSLSDLKNGISSILDNRKIDYTINSGLNFFSSAIENELNAGRPVIIGLSGILGGVPNKKDGHWVVAYGESSYTYDDGKTYYGYVAHFGWSTGN